jgi:hypothetical protein
LLLLLRRGPETGRAFETFKFQIIVNMASGLRPRPNLNPLENAEEAEEDHDLPDSSQQGADVAGSSPSQGDLQQDEQTKRTRRLSRKALASKGIDVRSEYELAAERHAALRRARRSQPSKTLSTASPRGPAVGGRRVAGKRVPLWHGTDYDLSEFSGLLSNAPQELSGQKVNSMSGGGADGGEPSSSGCRLSAAELQALAELTVDSKNSNSMNQYKTSARKLEFFLKYGHSSDLVQRWYQANSKCALPLQSTDLAADDEGAMAVRALKWAAANFPGYYEAMKGIDKKPSVVNSSTFESFAAAMNMVYKLQVLKSNLSRTRPARIRDYHVVDWTFKALFDQMMKKDAM